MRGVVAGVRRARRAGRLAAALAVLGACALGAGALQIAEAAASAADVLKVRLGGDNAETRLVLDVNQKVAGKLVSDGSGDGKVVISLSGVDVPQAMGGAGQGLVKTWSVAGSGSSARVTIELAKDAVVRRRFLLPPGDGVTNYRYVIDLKSTAAVPQARLTKAPAPAKPVVIKAAAPSKRVIVIDAGHGGKDPGARGASSREKDVTLAAARALKARLEKSGRYKVVMTRDSDVFIPLESRVKVARRADADLFISLHADAGPDENTRGLSVYTLSEKGADRATRVMGKEDWLIPASNARANPAVNQILMDLTQRATKNRSSQFAEMLLDRVDDEVPLLRRSHRDAGFVVLLAPDVPAVLLEMGFITSPDDESVLASPAGRKRLMDAVGDSIDAYFGKPTQLASR
ncbi:MAG TPA: N-acetylmuramoyl-L-alanine amidase [Caulobacteraceae bacterium]|nr:N-acetylmuramoyl-L-alanine amidase [Caulobacteraceae bacterium]